MSTTPGIPRAAGAPRKAHRATAEDLKDVQELQGKGRTVLVTGASGMLGESVARRLLSQGWTVRVLQRGQAPIALEDGVEQVLGSITDMETVKRALDGVDDVIHLAAKVSFAGDWEDFVFTNITGTRILLESARKAGAKNFVFVSSPSVAHTGVSIAGDGAGPANPYKARGNYARSKAAAELLALEADSDALRVTAVRPHIVWGPGDTQLVGRVVERARVGRMVVIGDGTALIDTTYMDDAADALVAALDHAADDDAHGRAFVISSAQPRTVGELLAKMAVAGGAPAPTRRIPTRAASAAGHAVEAVWKGLRLAGHPLGAEEPPLTSFLAEQLGTAHWFDQRRTRQALGWRPAVALDDGFAALARDLAATAPGR